MLLYSHFMFGYIMLQHIAVNHLTFYIIFPPMFAETFRDSVDHIKTVWTEATETMMKTVNPLLINSSTQWFNTETIKLDNKTFVLEPVGESRGGTFQYFISTFSFTKPAVKCSRWVCRSTRHKHNSPPLRPASFEWMRRHVLNNSGTLPQSYMVG